MFSAMYGYCPVCGIIHDDGTIFEYKGKKYFLCLNCSERRSDKEINESLEKLQGN